MGPADRHGRGEPLSFEGPRVNSPHDVHAADHPSEGGEALPIGLPSPADIDEPLAELVRQAYAVGQQEHLRSSKGGS